MYFRECWAFLFRYPRIYSSCREVTLAMLDVTRTDGNVQWPKMYCGTKSSSDFITLDCPPKEWEAVGLNPTFIMKQGTWMLQVRMIWQGRPESINLNQCHFKKNVICSWTCFYISCLARKRGSFEDFESFNWMFYWSFKPVLSSWNMEFQSSNY